MDAHGLPWPEAHDRHGLMLYQWQVTRSGRISRRSVSVPERLSGPASRMAALLLVQRLPAFSVVSLPAGHRASKSSRELTRTVHWLDDRQRTWNRRANAHIAVVAKTHIAGREESSHPMARVLRYASRRFIHAHSGSLLAAILACVAAVATVQADWSSIAATAAIDEGDRLKVVLNNDGSAGIRSTISSTSAKLRFSVVKTPSLLVTIPRPDEVGSLVFVMRARDNGPAARVIATLKRVTFGYYGGPQRADVVAVIDSDDHPQGDGWLTINGSLNSCCWIRNRVTGGAEALNFLDSAYFVEVQLIKNSAEGNPGVLAVGVLRGEP